MISLKISKKILPDLIPSVFLFFLIGLLFVFDGFEASLLPGLKKGLIVAVANENISFFPLNWIEYQLPIRAIETIYLVGMYLQLKALTKAYLTKDKSRTYNELKDFCYLLSLPIIINLIPCILIAGL